MYFVRCLILLSVSFSFIKCEFPSIDISNEDEDVDEKLVIVTALFTKLDSMMMEIEKITKNINNINDRLDSQKDDENINLQLLKADIRELNQTIKTDGLEMIKKLKEDDNINLRLLKADIRETIKSDGMEMQQQLFKKLDSQKDDENINLRLLKADIRETIKSDVMEMQQQLLKKIDLESFNTTLNKISQIQPLKQNWLVILRRQDGSVNFDRTWLDYKNGFGNPNGEYFIGLEKLHAITTYGERQELLIILRDFDNNTRYAKYDNFVVGNETEKYKIKKLGAFSGDAGNSFSPHLNFPFSTKDQFNGDDIKYEVCAREFKSGWWFGKCYNTLLTAPYSYKSKSDTGNGIEWDLWHGYDYCLKFVEMMVRSKSY